MAEHHYTKKQLADGFIPVDDNVDPQEAEEHQRLDMVMGHGPFPGFDGEDPVPEELDVEAGAGFLKRNNGRDRN